MSRKKSDYKIVHGTDGQPRRIVNHNVVDSIGYVPAEITGSLSREADDNLAMKLGLFKYSSRSLCISKTGDIIQLNPGLKAQWDWICRHYRRIGLDFSDEVIWDDSFEIIRELPPYDLSVFYFGQRANMVRPDFDRLFITELMNSKNEFIRLCLKLGIPTPATFLYETKKDLQDTADFKYPCRFKVARSVSGLGVHKCHDRDELEHCLSLIDDKTAFQIQEELPDATFINLQYEMNGQLSRLAATEQVIEGNSHAGNIFPTKYQPWSMTDRLAKNLVNRGLRGIFAFDLAVTGRSCFAIEINPRVNGSTNTTVVAQKLGVPIWISKNFNCSKTSLEQIDLAETEFSQRTKTGAVVFNWGIADEGKLGIMICGNLRAQRKIEERLKQILS